MLSLPLFFIKIVFNSSHPPAATFNLFMLETSHSSCKVAFTRAPGHCCRVYNVKLDTWVECFPIDLGLCANYSLYEAPEWNLWRGVQNPWDFKNPSPLAVKSLSVAGRSRFSNTGRVLCGGSCLPHRDGPLVALSPRDTANTDHRPSLWSRGLQSFLARLSF